MSRSSWFVAAALAVLAASCGPAATTTSTETATVTETATATSTIDVTAAMAALPAPYNTADYEAGKRVFGQCKSCHAIGANRVGPDLKGLIGRTAGTHPDFSYSPAMKAAGFSWDAEHLERYINTPAAVVPGNRMAFVGVHDATQRRNLIAYLMVETK